MHVEGDVEINIESKDVLGVFGETPGTINDSGRFIAAMMRYEHYNSSIAMVRAFEEGKLTLSQVFALAAMLVYQQILGR